MKLICTFKRSPVILCMFVLIMQNSTAQICANPAGVMYGMDNNGAIFPVNVATGAVGARINPAFPGNPPASSNAIGYNPGNGRFYFFKRNADQAPQEFVSFNPVTNTYTIHASCPTTLNIRTGCVSPSGNGYYCIDASANLYFYRFTSNTWRFITNTYFDQFGTNVSATLAALSSGDIAMDGWGDLWFLCSSSTNYGLYYFRGALPVNPVASLNIIQKISPATPTPGGTNLAGIGFSPTGQIYLSQSTGSDRLYRLNNNLTLTFIGTFTTPSVGADFTSCVMPFAALAINQIDLTVQQKGDQQMLLTWSNQYENVKGYYIEYSLDAEKWTTLGYVESSSVTVSNLKYTFTNSATTSGRYYYRIHQVGVDGQSLYSSVKFIDIKFNDLISISPNPTKGIIQVNNSANAFNRISIFDITGKLMKESALNKGLNSIALSSFPSGTYMIRMQAGNGQTHYEKIIKE